MTPKTAVHLLSGGLDSVIALYYLISEGYEVHCFLVDYGQRHVQELTWARLHCHRLNILYTTCEIPMLMGSSLTDGDGSIVVPFRNPILISLAVNLAASLGSQLVTIGCNADDAEMFPDCRPETLAAQNQIIKLCGIDVKIWAPFINQKKWWIARLGSDLKVPVYETWSCYEGGIQPCGHCLACKKRKEALAV